MESLNEEDKHYQPEKEFISKEVLDELYNSENDDDEEENSPFAHEKNIKMDQTSMFMDKYESDVNLPSVANHMANLIINFEQNNEINYVVEDEVEHEQSEREDTSEDEGFDINEYGIVITLEQVHNIQPQNCFIEALYLFDILTDDLKQCKHNHEKRQLQVLLEASQIILEKLDTYCESSLERRKLCKSIREGCKNKKV